MRIHYVGKGTDKWGYKNKQRGAEITSRYDEDEREEDKRDFELFNRTIELLKIHGWKFTEGIVGWAFCELADKAEFNEFHEDYKDCKRCIMNCMKFGF